MNKLMISVLLLCTLSMVMCQYANLSCPRSCNHPKTKDQCLACLNDGFSDVVKGNPGVFMGARRLWNQMEQGGHIDWDGKQCWILIKGIKVKNDCHEVGPGIFGTRCSGFEKATWKVLTKNCWAKFKA